MGVNSNSQDWLDKEMYPFEENYIDLEHGSMHYVDEGTGEVVLSGAVNPSGRLPSTFPVKLNDHASNANFPQVVTDYNPIMLMIDKKEKPKDEWVENVDYTNYAEGIYVGYRHFDKAALDVSFPFGYGLSYTNFAYENATLVDNRDSVGVLVQIENTGEYAGKEVIQFYTANLNSEMDQPVKELRAFHKTDLIEPGQMETVRIMIPKADLAYWNEEESAWKIDPSRYRILLGKSSRSIFYEAEFDVESIDSE